MGVAIGDRRWKEYRWRKRKRGWLAESEEHAARGDEITIYRVVNFKCATEKKYNNQSGGECHRLAVLVTGVHSGRGPLPSEVEAYVESQKKKHNNQLCRSIRGVSIGGGGIGGIVGTCLSERSAQQITPNRGHW